MKVRYTFQIAGETETFSESDILPPGMDINLRAKQQVMLWNELCEKTGEPERSLVQVDITDCFLHEHVWEKINSYTNFVVCCHCEVKGQREKGGSVTRDKKWEGEYYEYCHEKKPKVKPPQFK